jgi:hypothetical protein
MELVFLLIFFFFILMNVIIGLISSRAKKKRLIESRERESRGEEAPLQYEERTPETLRRQVDSFVEPQTVVSLMESLYPEILVPQAEEPERIEPEVTEKKAPVTAFTPPESEVQVSPTEKPEPEIKPLYEVEPEYKIGSFSFDWRGEQKGSGGVRIKSPAWKRIESLPPLKRAIVLSELLGEPKGL